MFAVFCGRQFVVDIKIFLKLKEFRSYLILQHVIFEGPSQFDVSFWWFWRCIFRFAISCFVSEKKNFISRNFKSRLYFYVCHCRNLTIQGQRWILQSSFTGWKFYETKKKDHFVFLVFKTFKDLRHRARLFICVLNGRKRQNVFEATIFQTEIFSHRICFTEK